MHPTLPSAALLAALWLALPAAAGPIWRDVDEAALRAALPPGRTATAQRGVVPRAYRTLQVDLPALRARLAAAPREFTAPLQEAGVEIALPLPYGDYGRFLVLESPILEPGLAARYPEVRTYLAQGVDDPAATARLDLTARGFRAFVLSPRGQFLIDPYWLDDDSLCIAYYQRHAPVPVPWSCGVKDEVDPASALTSSGLPQPRPSGATLRTYRLAVATTGEFSAAVAGSLPPSKALTLSTVVTIINRLNGIYERDAAIRFVLAQNTDDLFHLDPETDGYTNHNLSALTGENQARCDRAVGPANYDLGHVFSTAGGGLAGLRVVCGPNKASGASGSGGVANDAYILRIVAHEIGHQLGASHTFNGNGGACASNRSAGAAYEPGSGSTILGYAGICDAQSLQPLADDYLHTGSYTVIDFFADQNPVCYLGQPTGNRPPVIAPLVNRVIPSRTPFALTASASDADGDALTYCWEQFNLGAAQNPTAIPRDNGTAPLFRSLEPSLSPTRLFPALTYILNNVNVPPPTVGGFASAEFLPTTNRTMTFRVTVRDNRAGGGGADFGSMTVQSVAAAGPFALTSHNAPSTLAAGSATTVTWDVAGTTGHGINCASVNIRLSMDGGLTFPVLLAAGVPNHGAHEVVIPAGSASATTQARFKVEAADNIFFDLNDADLTITAPPNSAPTLVLSAPTVTVTRGGGSAVTANVGTVSDASGQTLSVALGGVPIGATVTPTLAGGVLSLTAQASCTCDSGGVLALTVTDGLGATASGVVQLIVQENPGPTLGDYLASVAVPRGGRRVLAPSASAADANGNLGLAPFRVFPEVLPGGGSVSVEADGNVTIAPGPAAGLGPTALTVLLADQCGATVARRIDLLVTEAQGPVATALAAGALIGESCLPTNGRVDPGEFVTVPLPLRNDGSAPTVGLVAELLPAGGLTPVGDATRTYGAFGQGQTAVRNFSFIARGTCGQTVTATLQLSDGGVSLGTASYAFVLGGPPPSGCSTCPAALEFVSPVPASPLVVGSPYTHHFGATGSPPPQFSLTAGTLPPGVTLSPEGLLAGTPTSAGTGSFPNLTVTATNGISASVSQTFSLQGVTRAANYLAAFGLKGPSAQPTADPNGDGVPNLLTYALGLNPVTASAHLLPSAAIKQYRGVPFVFVTFARSSLATDLTYRVEVSGDLAQWSTLASSAGGAATSGPGFVSETGTAPTYQVEVRDTVPVDATAGRQRFLRLQVSGKQ